MFSSTGKHVDRISVSMLHWRKVELFPRHPSSCFKQYWPPKSSKLKNPPNMEDMAMSIWILWCGSKIDHTLVIGAPLR